MLKRWLAAQNDLNIQLLVLYLLLVFPFASALLVFDIVIGQRIQEDTISNHLALARAIAQETDFQLANALIAVENLAQYPGVVQADPDSMHSIFSIFAATHPDINLVYRLSESGRMLFHYPIGPGSTVGQNFSFRAYYASAKGSASPLISDGRISPTTDQPVATAVMPIRNATGEFTGLVGTNIKLANISKSLSDIQAEYRPGNGFQVIIIDAAEQIIVSHNSEQLLLKAEHVLPPVFKPSLRGNTGSSIENDLSGRETLYAYVPIPSAGWGVVVSRPTSTAFATKDIIHRITLIVVVLFIIVGIYFWVALSRRVIKPIELLAAVSVFIGSPQKIDAHNRSKLVILAQRPDQVGNLIRSLLRMDETITNRLQEQSILLETSQAVVSSLDIQIVLNRILEQVERLMGVKKSAILALKPQKNVFQATASRGLSKQYAQQISVQTTEKHSVTMRAVQSQEAIQVSDTETDPSFSSLRTKARAEGYRSILAIPLRTQHAPPSALLVFHTEPHVFSADEIRLLTSFANYAAMAIENAALYARSDMNLKKQTRRIEALIQSQLDGLLLGDLNGNVVYANRRVSELAQLAPEELNNTPVHRILNRIAMRSTDPETMLRELDAIAERKGDRVVEMSIQIHSRREHLRITAFDVTDVQDVYLGSGFIIHDITTDRELDEMKSSLISTVSHELRTPLAAIKGYATTLLAEDVEWDRNSQKEFLSIISNETDRLTELVKNLLDLSRIEAGSLQLSKTECDIKAEIDKVVRSAWQTSEARITVQVDDNIPPVLVDPLRLQTILRNLLENAVKYASPNPVISIRVSVQNQDHVFRIIDNGPGIPLEESKHIFRSFYRIDDGLTRKTSGAGLGLAICEGLVTAHGGKIWIEPKESGACIAFSIPVIDTQPLKNIF